MTVNRWILLAGTAVACVLVFLAFGPLNLKWCYMVQVHYLERHEVEKDSYYAEYFGTAKVPENFTGHWKAWWPDGRLQTDCVFGDEIPDMPLIFRIVEGRIYSLRDDPKNPSQGAIDYQVFVHEDKGINWWVNVSYEYDGQIKRIFMIDQSRIGSADAIEVYKRGSLDRRAEFGIDVE